MIKAIGIIIPLVVFAACDDPLIKECTIPVWMDVQQSVIPDSCRLDESVQIEVEVIGNDSSYKYVGPDIENTDLGCTIRIMGERNVCEPGIPTISYEWNTFDIRPITFY